MFSWLFSKPKPEKLSPASVLEKSSETLQLSEEKKQVCIKKAVQEAQKAEELTGSKNTSAASRCLKKKRLYEQQVEQIENIQRRIHDQMIMLEEAKDTAETVYAIRSRAAAMKAMQKAMNLDDVDKTMDEINEQTENMKQIHEASSAPLSSVCDFDENELEAELEALVAEPGA